MNTAEIENNLNQSLDEILYQLSKGNTIEGLKNGQLWIELEQVKEWKSKFGFQFHIYSNDHLIEHKPHFHLKKPSENIDCRMFFVGTIYDCQGGNQIDKRTKEAIEYFLSNPNNYGLLIELWNQKNPTQKVS
jgi:hypothetical protein